MDFLDPQLCSLTIKYVNTYQLHMKLFNHLHLQIHNILMACFSREECKIFIRIITVLPALDHSRKWLNAYRFTLLLIIIITIVKIPLHLVFIYSVLGTVSCTSDVRTHLIFTTRCNYYLHFTSEVTESQSSYNLSNVTQLVNGGVGYNPRLSTSRTLIILHSLIQKLSLRKDTGLYYNEIQIML